MPQHALRRSHTFIEPGGRPTRAGAENRVDRPPAAGDTGSYNELWFDCGMKAVATRHSSLVIDPPNRRVPPLTPAAQQRQQVVVAYARLHPADGPRTDR